MVRQRWLWVSAFALLLGTTWNCGDKKLVDGEKVAKSDAGGKDTTAAPDVRAVTDSGPHDKGATDAPGVREAPPTPTALTYHKDIRAIIKVKCLGCHQKGGIGPFALDEFQKVVGTRQAIASAVKEGRMPPWLGDKACNSYTNDISLSDEQRTKIVKWIEEGAVEGDPKEYVAPTKVPNIGLSRIDSSLKMKKAYTPKRSPDDHRCFVLDWPHKTTKYISGFGIKAGKLSMVHHVIAYLAHPKHASKYVQKDPDGNGYYCPGTAGGNAGLNWIGVWAPGVPGGNYPDGTGLQVDPGSKIILQVHYNTTATKPEADLSAVEFKLEDKVEKRALMVPFTNFLSWTSNKGMKIPKDDPAKKFDFSVPMSLLGQVFKGLKELKIYSAMLHMHQLGAKASLSVTKDDEYQCLLDIPRWDFNWQLMYNLQKPITVGGSDIVRISCTFDNSSTNQPLIGGKKRESVDVFWGDNTADEMCLGVLYVTCGDTPCPKLDSF